MKFETISVVGLGYIGLPTAAVIASNGIRVVGVDVNQHAVDTINQGMIHIVEPGLEDLVKRAVNDGHLTAHTSPQKADAFLIAVPTPFKGEEHEPDLKYIESASRALAPMLEKGNLVVLESTSPVGATEQMAKWLAEERSDLTFPHTVGEGQTPDIFVAHCPERVLPGQVIRELVENDRIIGGMDEASTAAATQVYKMFVKKGECIATSARTAEMSKLTENAFRDVNIAFANELSLICDQQGINVWELISLANRHPRVNILQPGCGVGGHCIAVDPWFIVNQNPETAKMIRQARLVNDYKPHYVVEQVEKAVAGIDNPKIACLGLAFKPDIDDLRESPALDITATLANNPSYEIFAVEPNIETLPASLENRNNVRLSSVSDSIQQADVVVILVKHQQFIGLQKNDIKSGLMLNFVNA
ncbi:TPA: UDP-N-acetyl-D-mannosamine dehydrogenase [Escherichia coli]|uniref:UDP-N-acetyl-D-mannosamine dehydrogenase n=1 Tax=Escherichia coli TaxID=562 RepID=A0A7T7GQD0_ECOLX|nr:UDP-N-acetyl-D-mannosamine dehydrogenase [Escherichia coli]MBE7625811.1 UDP-N-acetyl-D-mannosamine dehydrogenase [Escherichia coli]MBL6577733.1 UDP-N-acetyl-D-mannosamine dehydrogenase [Escherichia coli]MBL6582562.1 UDP-N-acetyl-D-mannosamine dehydrogenase [Escherichia coli]QQM12393.1 UDP-N-acetyl-D-mannosamine dehydrogenase [Escherichia coli]HEC5268292.1 UDP-N-acetyl-D-mannosamine dehydrogenase [Escherichia coli]